MPSVFFAKSAGKVIRLIDRAAPCTTRFYGLDKKILFQEQKAIVTRLTMSQNANVQFLHTLGSNIYIYVFGDRIGELTLSGLGFSTICQGEGCDPMTGLEGTYQWYRDYRVTKKKQPLNFTIGSVPLEAFLVGYNADVIDAASGLMQWQMQLATLPEN